MTRVLVGLDNAKLAERASERDALSPPADGPAND